jgi:hypothetical protein
MVKDTSRLRLELTVIINPGATLLTLMVGPTIVARLFAR